jgi:hypothetical protein
MKIKITFICLYLHVLHYKYVTPLLNYYIPNKSSFIYVILTNVNILENLLYILDIKIKRQVG